MNIDLTPFEQKRKEASSKAMKFFFIGGPLVIIGIILVAIGVMADPVKTVLVIVGVILVVIGGLICGLGGAKLAKIGNELKNEVVSKLITEVYPGAVYDFKKGLSEGAIMEPGFFKRPDRFHSKNYFAGKYKEIPFEVSDFKLEELHVTTDSHGNTTTTYEVYAAGRMVIIDFKRDIKDTVKVLETKWLGASLKGLQKVEMESIDFNKKFATYASSDQAAFFILTPQFQLKLLELEQKFKGSIFFGFENGKLFVGINDNTETLKFNVMKELNDKQVEKILSQIGLPAAIINELKLDSAKWTM